MGWSVAALLRLNDRLLGAEVDGPLETHGERPFGKGGKVGMKQPGVDSENTWLGCSTNVCDLGPFLISDLCDLEFSQPFPQKSSIPSKTYSKDPLYQPN